ncbi:MAG: YggT family protein [Legionellaceae bacterium]
MSGLISVLYFLTTFFFGALVFTLWARCAFRFFHISVLHPAAKVILDITNPIVLPLNYLLTTLKVQHRRYDIAAMIMIFLIEIFKFIIIGLLSFGLAFPWNAVFLYAFADMIIEPCNLLFYAIMIRVIISWVKPNWQHPLHYLCVAVTEPMMRSIRKRLPSYAGLDFSPLIMIVALEIITIFISSSLPSLLR